MPATDVIAIFDIGKTNKKLLLFDTHYRIVYESSACLDETVDEDGYPCENLRDLQRFISDSLQRNLRILYKQAMRLLAACAPKLACIAFLLFRLISLTYKGKGVTVGGPIPPKYFTNWSRKSTRSPP